MAHISYLVCNRMWYVAQSLWFIYQIYGALPASLPKGALWFLLDRIWGMSKGTWGRPPKRCAMVSIEWYLGHLKGQLGGVGIRHETKRDSRCTKVGHISTPLRKSAKEASCCGFLYVKARTNNKNNTETAALRTRRGFGSLDLALGLAAHRNTPAAPCSAYPA